MTPIHKLHQFMFSFGRTVEKSLQEKLQISYPQFMILLAVKNNPKCTQATVAEWRKLTPAAISQHIDSLLKRGLIAKKNNSQDRREHAIVMTPKGILLFKKASVIFEKNQKQVFQNISKKAIADMNTTLDTLLLAIDKSSMPPFIHYKK